MPTAAPGLRCDAVELADVPPTGQREPLAFRREAARSAAALNLAATADAPVMLCFPARALVLLPIPLLWLLWRSFAFSSRRNLTSGERLLIALPTNQSNDTHTRDG